MRILYVEDEKYLAEAVIHLLNKEKIAVSWANDGKQGLELALHDDFDCIVLDIMLPGISGWEILKILRERKIMTPVIMLSALSEVDDKVRALNYGADDYLAKPFKTAELIARLKALVRRPANMTSEITEFGDLKFDRQAYMLNELALTEKEVRIMELLLRHPEQVVAKERLLTYGWNRSEAASENYVEVYISHLRSKLKQLDSKTEIITVRSLGYKIIEKKNVS